jgi:transposase
MLPQSYPNYKTVHRRFQTWCRDEVLRRVLTDVANELRDRRSSAKRIALISQAFLPLSRKRPPARPPGTVIQAKTDKDDEARSAFFSAPT